MSYWDKIGPLFGKRKEKQHIEGLDDRTSLLLILIKLAKADGHIDYFEQQNIDLLYHTLGANISIVEQWKDRLDEVSLIIPKTKDERVHYFWRILSMMKADLYAHPKELKMCRDLGITLQFEEVKVDEALHYMQESMDRIISLQEFKLIMQ